jgi:hypothetical protein
VKVDVATVEPDQLDQGIATHVHPHMFRHARSTRAHEELLGHAGISTKQIYTHLDAAGDLLSIPLMRAQISAYQADQRKAQAMDEQPLPGAEPAIITGLG